MTQVPTLSMFVQRVFLSRYFALFVYIAFLIARDPELIYPGRFWAEEGTIYFYEAYTNSPGSVLATPHVGYYSLLNKLAAIAAARMVPLQFAPVVTGAFAMAVQILPAGLLLFCRVPALKSRLYRICAVFLLLFVQPNQEVWINTVNSQFFLCVLTAVILISQPVNRWTYILRLGLLLLSGLTGAISCLLLPFFWLEFACSRHRQTLREALTLTLACGIQAAFVMAGPGRATNPYLHLLPFILLAKQWILPLSGSGAARAFAEWVKEARLFDFFPVVFLALLPYVVVGTGLVRWGRRHAVLLFCASLFIGSVSFLKGLYASQFEMILGHLYPYNAGRYYYAPNVLFALALLMPLREVPLAKCRAARYFRRGCVVAIALMLASGSYDFVTSNQTHDVFFEGPSWPAEVSRWQQGKSDVLQIWPRPWYVTLPRD